MSGGTPNRTSDQQLRRRIIIEDRFVVSSRGLLGTQEILEYRSSRCLAVPFHLPRHDARSSWKHHNDPAIRHPVVMRLVSGKPSCHAMLLRLQQDMMRINLNSEHAVEAQACCGGPGMMWRLRHDVEAQA